MNDRHVLAKSHPVAYVLYQTDLDGIPKTGSPAFNYVFSDLSMAQPFAEELYGQPLVWKADDDRWHWRAELDPLWEAIVVIAKVPLNPTNPFDL
jgi:hypothetical protein